MRAPHIIGIAGASGSGKTVLAERLYDYLSKEGVSLLSFDDYYREDFTTVSVPDPAMYSSDVPDAVDTELLEIHLKRLCEGHPIERPVYDMRSNRRISTSVRVEPNPFLIVEGVYALSSHIRSYFATKVFVDLALEECLARRVERDRNSRGRANEDIVRRFYESIVPAYRLYVLPFKDTADVIVSGDGDLNESVQNVMNHIRNQRAIS